MFKTKVDDEYWMVTQPDHMEVAGYLAAHWGNRDFLSPGSPFGADGEARSAAVWSIAYHDNGWWEWEAEPRLDQQHHLPVGLPEVLADLPEALERWRIGVKRFARGNPFGSALIAHHALNLYRPRLDDAPNEHDIHPLFWKHLPPVADRERADVAAFVDEMSRHKASLLARIGESTAHAHWAGADSLALNGRLIQVLDAIAIYLSSNLIPPLADERPDGFTKYAWNLLNVPRSSVLDSVTIEVRPTTDGKLRLTPYPFDIDPLPVQVPVRVSPGFSSRADFDFLWNAIDTRMVRFAFTS